MPRPVGAPTAAHVCSPLQEAVRRCPPSSCSPIHPGLQPPPRERSRNTHRGTISKTKGERVGAKQKDWERGEKRQTDGQPADKMASGGGRRGTGWAAPEDQAGRAGGRRAGGRRDTEAVLPPPPARCPGRSARLISHLAAPGPVCAQPGIPPAAQTAPAPSLSPPRFLLPAAPLAPGRPAAGSGPLLGRGAHAWPRLEGTP